MNQTEPKIIYVYSSYTDAQKRAIKKYADNNRDKINQHMKNYYDKQKKNDPDFLEKRRAASKKAYYKKKKALLENKEKSI